MKPVLSESKALKNRIPELLWEKYDVSDKLNRRRVKFLPKIYDEVKKIKFLKKAFVVYRPKSFSEVYANWQHKSH